MKKRFIQRNFNFTQEDIDFVSKKYGFDEKSNFLLKKYSVNSENAVEFFSDGENGLFDPFLMKNMSLAVDKIKKIKQENKKVLIFGDYDADGISAAAILKRFFDDFGIDSSVYLPKRSEGYGLKIETLMRLFREEKFDVVITVDCGITAVEEVEFIKKILKADILITDHHEPAEKLPNCICINPKLGYLFRDLSGSGVALKLVQALTDAEYVKQYCDLASIGTIADIMPLVSENRAIVKLACRNINNLGLKTLMAANKVDINSIDSNTMAMKICPKINAAGRVDEPSIALDVLLTDDVYFCQQKVELLMKANMQRQILTEKTFDEAMRYIQCNNLADLPAIFVYGDDWKHGILGLVANKLVQKYKVAVGAFMPDGDNIVGSMRTPEGINLYKTVTELKSCLLRFGGHEMSVGVSLFKDGFEDFYRKFLSKISEIKGVSPERYYDVEFDIDFLSETFLNQVKLFEPIASNNKVVYKGEFSVKNIAFFGKNKNFLKILTQDGIELKTFSDFTKYSSILKPNCNFECLFTLEYDDFEKKYVGLMSDINILNSISFDELYVCNYLDNISFNNKNEFEEIVSIEQLKAFIQEKSCCCVFDCMLEFERFAERIDFEDFYLDFFYPNQLDNTVLISPARDVDLSKYSTVVYFNRYENDIERNLSDENVYYFDERLKTPTFLSGLQINRDTCVKIFRSIVQNLNMPGFSKYDLYIKSGVFEYTFGTFLCVFKIFEELKIFNVIEKPFEVIYNKGIKVNLEDSLLYRMVSTEII